MENKNLVKNYMGIKQQTWKSETPSALNFISSDKLMIKEEQKIGLSPYSSSCRELNTRDTKF